MNIFISRPHGYCSGVIRAINLVKEARQKHVGVPVFVLGSIVHNEDVIKELFSFGITTVRDLKKSPAQLLKELPDQAVVVFVGEDLTETRREGDAPLVVDRVDVLSPEARHWEFPPLQTTLPHFGLKIEEGPGFVKDYF